MPGTQGSTVSGVKGSGVGGISGTEVSDSEVYDGSSSDSSSEITMIVSASDVDPLSSGISSSFSLTSTSISPATVPALASFTPACGSTTRGRLEPSNLRKLTGNVFNLSSISFSNESLHSQMGLYSTSPACASGVGNGGGTKVLFSGRSVTRVGLVRLRLKQSIYNKQTIQLAGIKIKHDT
ncbi:hypothetical protein ACFFRR_001466 [Megaselia abdita]